MTKTLKDKSQYNIYMTKTLKDFHKFPIGKDKAPLVAWRKSINWSRDDFIRSGIPCGKENGIIVVDIDDYDMKDNNPFIEAFGKDYDTQFNTLIVLTTSGGKHIYFKYDEELNRTAHNNDLCIDFQSNGSYVVSPSSDCYTKAEKHLPTCQRQTKKYKIIKNRPISAIPDNLKQFLMKEVIGKDKKKVKQDCKDKRHKAVKHNAVVPYYKYKINEDVMKIITENIPDKLFQSYNTWWKLASAYKEAGYKDLFLKYSILKAPFYKGQETKNEELYDSITQFNEFNFIWLLKIYFDEEDDKDFTHTKNFINTYKCKEIYSQPLTIKVDETINVNKLGYGMEVMDGRDYIIKSDTGTGKTTIVKEFLRTINPNLRFVSITARISLAAEQYRVFREADLSCKYYEDIKYEWDTFKDTDSCCICVNSINMLGRQDFQNTIAFLDEYNSLIEDVFCSPTMKNRIEILATLIRIIKECYMVIAVDADIQPHTLEFLKFCGRSPYFIQNDFLHNSGNTAIEWDSVDTMCADMITKDKWLLCSDSKTSSKTIFKEIAIGEQMPLTDGEKKLVRGLDYYKDTKGIIVCITAEAELSTNFALDNFDRVIFSPKIIYGLDGTLERDVYCLYEEQTISPRAMNQQVNRCRNIKSLNYVFLKNLFVAEKFVQMDDIYETIEKTSEYSLFKSFASNEVNTMYKNMTSIISFNNDSFSTNKKAHFVQRLRDAGWNINASTTLREDKVNTDFKESKKIMKADEYENFIELYEKHKPYIENINKCFHIPEEKFNEYKNIFLDSQASRTRNFNLGRFLFISADGLIEDLKEKKEFNDKKFKNDKYKVAFLQQFMMECGATNKLQFKIGDNNQFTNTEWAKVSEATKKKYELMFKPTKKMLESKHNPIIKMMSDLFGTSVVEAWDEKKSKTNSISLFNEKKTTIKGKSIRIKTSVNNDFIEKHLEVMKYRINNDNKTLKEGNLDLSFGGESNNFNYTDEEYGECMIDVGPE